MSIFSTFLEDGSRGQFLQAPPSPDQCIYFKRQSYIHCRKTKYVPNCAIIFQALHPEIQPDSVRKRIHYIIAGALLRYISSE